MVRFDLGPLLQGQTRIAELKIAHNLLIIGPRGLKCETSIKLVGIPAVVMATLLRFFGLKVCGCSTT